MAIIPKIGGGDGGGTIRGAVSSVSGAAAGQIRGVISREAGSLASGSALGQAARVVDLRTGGLLSAGKDLLGIANGGKGDVSTPTGTAQGKGDPPASKSRLPQWGHLSPHLFARIFPCDSKGKESMDSKGGSSAILAPATDVQFESTLNWQSPFENTGPESKAPTLMALLQTGQIATVANAIQAVLPSGKVGDFAKDLAGNTERWAKSLEGRTGITKLNSRQVFSGMPPVRVTLQLHLRAVNDTQAEVMAPYEQLLRWAWPQELAENGIISEVLTNGDDIIRAMFPSLAPQMVGFHYGNNRFMPMVIESVANPLDGPMDRDGRPLYRSVALTLATLTALDTNDVPKLFSRS